MGGTGRIRFAAAGTAGLVAVLYLLIGFDVITVVEAQASAAEAGAAPVLVAGVLFAALAVLLVVSATRPVLVAGVVLQVMVLVMYFVVSVDRIPAFEAWGLGIKALQLGLLVAFVAMLVRQPRTVGDHAATPA